MSGFRFLALDGFRGVFSLTVLLNHAIQSVTGWHNDGPFRGPHLSVAYFFIISGFVLTHAHKKNEKFSKYVLVRLARLWPLTFFSTLLMILIYSVRGSEFIPGDYIYDIGVLIGNFSFAHGVFPWEFPVINTPAWSIGIEFWSSLLIPLIFVKLQKHVRLISSILLFAFLAYKSDIGIAGNSLNGMYSFFIAMASMMLGSSCYSILHSDHKNIILKFPHIEIIMWFSFVLCMVGIYAQPYGVNRLDFFYIIAFVPLLAVDYLDDTSLIKRFMQTNLIQFFGYISFPLYLLHFPIMITGVAFRGSDSPFMGVLMMSLVSIFMAYLYTALIDIRFYRMLKFRINAVFDKPTTDSVADKSGM